MVWVLIYIFSYSVVPRLRTTGRSGDCSPTVVFQEYSSEERCRAAKSKIEDTLKDAGDQVEKRLGRPQTSRRG